MTLRRRLVELLGEERTNELFARAQAVAAAQPRAPWVPDGPTETIRWSEITSSELYRALRDEHPGVLEDPEVAYHLGLCDICGRRVPYHEALANGGAWHDLCLRATDG